MYRPTEIFPPSTTTAGTGTPYPVGGHDFTWNTFRYPRGTYNLRTSKQDRLSPTSSPASSTCALGAVQIISDPHNVNLQNPAVIDSIEGAGNAGTSTEVTARLINGAFGIPFRTSGDTLPSQPTNKGLFAVGNIGRTLGWIHECQHDLR